MAWIKLARVAEVPRDTVIEVEHSGSRYAICNAGGEMRAVSGVCPHSGGPLGRGTMLQGMVICPWHMWEFDSQSGACLVDDRMGIPVYRTKVEGGEILVDLPENA